MTRKEIKAHILRCLAFTVRNDVDLGADYMFEDAEEGDAYVRREKQVASLAAEISGELERRADRLTGATRRGTRSASRR